MQKHATRDVPNINLPRTTRRQNRGETQSTSPPGLIKCPHANCRITSFSQYNMDRHIFESHNNEHEPYVCTLSSAPKSFETNHFTSYLHHMKVQHNVIVSSDERKCPEPSSSTSLQIEPSTTSIKHRLPAIGSK